LEQFRWAFELNPGDAVSAHNLAGTYEIIRDYETADQIYEREIQIAPQRPGGYGASAWNLLSWRGDTKSARAVMERIPTPAKGQVFSHGYWLEFFDRRYDAAITRLEESPLEFVASQNWFLTKAQLRGLAYKFNNETELSRAAYEEALTILEQQRELRPNDCRIYGSLGLVYAELGRPKDAVEAGKRGLELCPVARDVFVGPERLRDLALIYVAVDDFDAALDRVEELLRIPCRFSIARLKLDPRWDPLRDHPRYKDLIQRYEIKSAQHQPAKLEASD
jgi:serine/threonine-protein kinase